MSLFGEYTLSNYIIIPITLEGGKGHILSMDLFYMTLYDNICTLAKIFDAVLFFSG